MNLAHEAVEVDITTEDWTAVVVLSRVGLLQVNVQNIHQTPANEAVDFLGGHKVFQARLWPGRCRVALSLLAADRPLLRLAEAPEELLEGTRAVSDEHVLDDGEQLVAHDLELELVVGVAVEGEVLEDVVFEDADGGGAVRGQFEVAVDEAGADRRPFKQQIGVRKRRVFRIPACVNR